MSEEISPSKSKSVESWARCCLDLLDLLPIDDIDRKIITTLMRNSRASNVDIAKEVGISEGTVRRRIAQLAEKKLIRRFVPIINCDAIENCIKAFIRLKVDGVRLKDVADVLKGHKRVVSLYRVNDEFNLLCEGMFRSVIELQEFIDEQLHTDGILDSNVQMVIGSYKKCLWTGL